MTAEGFAPYFAYKSRICHLHSIEGRRLKSCFETTYSQYASGRRQTFSTLCATVDFGRTAVLDERLLVGLCGRWRKALNRAAIRLLPAEATRAL